MLIGTSVEVLLLLLLLDSLQAIISFFGLVGDGVSINDTHVVNNVCPLCP